MSQSVHLRKYGVETTINFELYEVDGVDFRTDAADGGSDCSIMKDEGAEATCTNDFTDEGTGYSLVLTATEMEAARIVVYVIDSATKVWLDKAIIIETYGHASAMHAMDFDDGVRAGLTALPNAAADAAGGLPISDAGGLDIDAKLANTNEVTAARMGALTDWINGGRLDVILDAIPTTPMRGTDNAATETKQDIIDGIVDELKAAVITNAAGADVAADIIALKAVADALDTLTKASGPGDLAAILADTDELQSDDVPGLISALETHGDAAWATATGFLDAAGVRTAVGLASANLDTQLGTLATAADLATVDGVVDDILEDTGTTIPATLATIAGYLDTEIADILEDTGTTIPATLATLATAANLATVDTAVDAIKAVTDALTAAAAAKLALSAAGITSGTATGDGSTSTLVDTGLSDRDDMYIGRTVVITGGAAAEEGGIVTDYDQASGTLSFAANTFTAAPLTGSTFVIL